MDAPHRIRITLAAALAAVAAASIVWADGVVAGDPADELFPDLKTVGPGGFSLALHHHTKNDTTILRLSNKIANAGEGPLELYSQPATGPCIPGDEFPDEPWDRDANQILYEDTDDNGQFDRGTDQVKEDIRVGCFEYHVAHNHWHFQDFSQYSLADIKSGEQIAGPSRKIGFCILDGERRYPDLPGSPQIPVYPENVDQSFGCGFGDPETGPGAMGLSVGYADIYTYSLPGQRLDVTGVPAGTYCLVSTANPPGGPSDIVESSHANNTRRRQITIDPERDRARWAGADCPAPKS
jgi:hypothetical protein